jgi:hypothetical protein
MIVKVQADLFDEVLGIWGGTCLYCSARSIEPESETACSSSKVNRLVCVKSPMTRLLRLFVVEQLRIFRLSLALYAIRKRVFAFDSELQSL